jgi:hypothetical protein
MLRIYTFASDEQRLEWLKETAALFQCQLTCLIKPVWSGYVDKLAFMQQTLAEVDDNDIVCFVDGYDVLINGSMADIESQFKSYGCDLLLGAELNCFPEFQKPRMDTLPVGPSLYRYVNSGGYIGYAHAVKSMLHWKPLAEIQTICLQGGDQTYVAEYYMAHCQKRSIKLDQYCRVFQNMHWVNWKVFKFQQGRLHNIVMRATPCFVHFNGGVYQTMERQNIMPVFVRLMKQSTNSESFNLQGYRQLITATCFPHKQHVSDTNF